MVIHQIQYPSHISTTCIIPQNMFFSIFGHKDNEKLLYIVKNR